MKKLILAVTMLVMFASISYFISSCNKKNEGCKTCKVNPVFQNTNTTFNNKKFDFRLYQSKDKEFYFQYRKESDLTQFNSFFSENEITNIISADLGSNKEILSVIVFSNEIPSKEFQLNSTNVKGLLLYFSNSNNEMTTRFISFEYGGPIENKDLNLETQFLSTNDVVNIAKQAFNIEIKSATAFINFSKLPKKEQFVEGALQTKLNTFINTYSKITAPSGRKSNTHYCDVVTCESTDQGYCVASESEMTGESWRCQPTECPKEEADSNNPSSINTNTQNDSLYNFRDNYLVNKTKGTFYINKYYELGTKLSKDSIDIAFSLATITIIENSILPIINQLKANPNSSTVLYNNTTRDNIVAYLLLAKNKFPRNTEKAEIDLIINDVNYLANKTALEIDTYLSTP